MGASNTQQESNELEKRGGKMSLESDLMIDTIRIKGKFLAQDIVPYVAHKLDTYVKYNSEAILYEFTSGKLQGSYDNRISFSIKDRDWFRVPGQKQPVLLEVPKYFEIECSLHKFVMGHNIFGGTDDLSVIHSLYDYLEVVAFGSRFIDRHSVEVLRIDIAEVYKFSSDDEVNAVFHGLRYYKKYRTKPTTYNNSGIYYPSTSTTFKIYDKHKEFLRHDAKRLKKVFTDEEYEYVKEMSKYCVRLECEIHKRKLNELFGGKKVYVEDLIMGRMIDIKDVYLKEKQRLIYEEKNDVALKMTNDVLTFIIDKLGSRKGLPLYNFWQIVTLQGDEVARKTFNKSTYYYNKKQLKELGVPFYEYGFNSAEHIGNDDDFPKIDI